MSTTARQRDRRKRPNATAAPATPATEPSLPPPPYERTRYYSRMVVSPDDLTRDQDYENGKRRYWTRILHGWGIVSGLECGMSTAEQSRGFDGNGAVLLSVSPGDALDPIGQEIHVSLATLVDIAHIDGLGNSIIVKGDGANRMSAGAAPPRSENGSYLFVIGAVDKPARSVPSPDGSGGCEPTVFRDAHVFRLIPAVEGAADDAAADGWVVLGTITDFDKPLRHIVLDDRTGFPIDPLDGADDSPDNLVHALAEGHLDRAEAHLDRWKLDIARGIRHLLLPAGLDALEMAHPVTNLEGVPAKDLKPCDDDAIGSDRLREFLIRAESPFLSGKPISVQCVARMTRDAFKKRVRFIFRDYEIPDEPIDHAHRAAVLLLAVVRQWPAPTFEGMLTHHRDPRRA